MWPWFPCSYGGGAFEAWADPAYHVDPGSGWTEGDTWDSNCPVTSSGGHRADYHSLFESLAFLEDLAGATHDPGDFLEIVEVGESTMMGVSGQYAGIELDSLLAARVSLDPAAPEPVRPAILLTCGVHANEWVASEVCLGYVDRLVKGANSGDPDVLSLLDRVEIWAVVQGNPGGRLWEDGGWTDAIGWGDPEHWLTKDQRKNMQWQDGFDCAQHSQTEPKSGLCSFAPDALWTQEGVNVARAFSVGFPGHDDPYYYTRKSMFPESQYPGLKYPNWDDLPDPSQLLAPEVYRCNNDAECAARFPKHPYCRQYLRGAVAVDGCFVAGSGDYNTVSLASCENWLDSSNNQIGRFDEAGIEHVCLSTPVPSPSGPVFRYLPWECGLTGAQQDAIPAFELPSPIHDLLWICRNGVLRSCRDDADCDGSYPASPIDDADFRPEYPHAGGERYCAAGFCAASKTRTCCGPNYRGQRPFESIEARLLRNLVDNVPFAFVLDMHASRNDLTYRCSDFAGGCSAGPMRDTGLGYAANATQAYNAAALADWAGQTTQWFSMPVFLDIVNAGGSAGGLGQFPPWVASPSAAVAGDPATTLNFDNGTYRGIPSFTWELGVPGYRDSYGEAYGILVRCDPTKTAGGKRPRTRTLLQNQLAGAVDLIDYFSRQAKVPNAGRHLNDTWIVSPFKDLGLSGLRIQDGHGRGVQQIETRYQGIAGDPRAVTVIPAGDWVVSMDVLAADTSGGQLYTDFPADLAISLGAKPSSSASPLFPVVDGAGVSGLYTPNTRTEVSRRFRFEAGNDYDVLAQFLSTPPLPASDVASNNDLRAKVRVIDCDSPSIPNGFGPDGFCQAGMPFADDRFECYGPTGRCRECWAGQACEGFLSFCVNGMCDSPATCWSGTIEDEFEGKPLKTGVGLGTHTVPRTMYKKNSPFDEDAIRIDGGDCQGMIPEHAVYDLKIRVRNLCSYWVLGDEPMDEVEIRVQQLSASLIGWEDLLGPAWKKPMRNSGLTVKIGAARVVGFHNDRPLRISVTNPTGEHFAYDLIATIDYAGMMMVAPDPQLPDMPVGIQDEVDVDIELGNYESFVPKPDPFTLDGQSLFFRPEAGVVPRTARFDLYSARGQFLRSAAPLDGGLAIPLDGLPESQGPFSARLYSDEGSLRGAVYLCPAGTADCLTYDPRRNSCGDDCDDPADLCCIDRVTGAVACADIGSDPENCGGCGVACEWDEVCLEGVCARGQGRSCWETVCPDGLYCVSEYWLTRKNPKCRALLVDNENCGWLGHVCPANKRCALGLCVPKCGVGCDGDCGQDTCCWVLGSQTCVDTTSNLLNCGACGHACVFGEVCADGACVPWYDEIDPCPFGLHNCGRFGEIQCRDLASDPSNCGICNGKCGSGATCVQGVCTLPAGESAVADD